MDQLCTYLILFIFITSFYTLELAFCSAERKSEKGEEDELEWRTLGKDEPVPRGSHVQLDLTTGERRIKVVRSEKTKKDETSVLYLKTDEEISDQRTFETINSRLRHIVGDDPKESGDESIKKDGRVKHKFRSYDELKKDFEDLHMAVKTDIEIMNNILENYKELVDDKVPVSEEVEGQQITMLTDLEYLLHQIDNANEFVKNGGLTNIILPSLNSTSSEVRSGTARLLGSAAQSNIAVQIAALESGAIGVLLRILVLDKTPSVRSSTLYALSCLVRRFPTAQKKFVDEGGLTVLYNLFSSDSPDKLKIQVKVLNLIHDLIVEKQDAEKTFTLITKEMSSNSSTVSLNEAKERLRQYNVIGLETRLQELHWCNQLSSLLIDHFSQHMDVILKDIGSKSDSSADDINIEHDIIEKVIEAMISSSNLCLSDYENNHKLKEVIRILLLWYKKLSKVDEDDDRYYEHLSKMFETLTWKYKIPLNEHLKDEL